MTDGHQVLGFLLDFPTSVGLPKAGQHLLSPRDLENSGGEELLGPKRRAQLSSTHTQKPEHKPTHQNWGLTWNQRWQALHLGLRLHL